jgi:hypothetical protein
MIRKKPIKPGFATVVKSRVGRSLKSPPEADVTHGNAKSALCRGPRTPHLVGNDHVYIAASKLDGNTLALRLWGYGAQDVKGFYFSCDYTLEPNTASCRENSITPKSVF